MGEGFIPRIAEEVSYIKGCPEGDIPNVEFGGWRTQSTEGVPVRDELTLSFHTRSLPTARLVWHCPSVSIYSSPDGRIGGEGYREYLLLRLDGENWESDDHAENEVRIDHTRAFVGWSAWKEKNKEGLDCRISIRRDKNQVFVSTENLGIMIDSITTIREEPGEIYAALTGDQCALTDIRVSGADHE